MPAQQRKSGTNYIAILSDMAEEQRAIEAPRKSNRRLKDYFLGLVAAVLNRHRRAR